MESLSRFFPRAEATIYLFAGLLVVLGAAYLLAGALVEGVGLLLKGEGGSWRSSSWTGSSWP